MTNKNLLLKSKKSLLIALALISFNWVAAYDLTKIEYDYLKGLEYNVSTIKMTDATGVLVANGSLYAYKTSSGRLGTMEIIDNGINLKVNWITYSDDKTVWNKGEGLLIAKLSYVDFDYGFTSTIVSKENDFRWLVTQSDVVRTLSPMNGMSFKLQDPFCIGSYAYARLYPLDVLKNYTFFSTPINATEGTENALANDDILGYITSEGRYGLMNIVTYNNGLLKFDWVTYAPNGNVYSTGCNQSIPETYGFDFDKGVVVSATADMDLHYALKTTIIRNLLPLNNAKVVALTRYNCKSVMKDLVSPLATLKEYTLSANKIDGSPNANNRLTALKKIAYKTSAGRYGIAQIESYGVDININWITYEASGAIYSSGCDFAIPANRIFDLDLGAFTDSGEEDFWWTVDQPVGTRFWTPTNKATFYVIGDPITGLQSEVNQTTTKIYPSPAKGHIVIEGISEITSLYIYGMNGAAINNITTNGNQIDVSGLNPGIYKIR